MTCPCDRDQMARAPRYDQRRRCKPLVLYIFTMLWLHGFSIDDILSVPGTLRTKWEPRNTTQNSLRFHLGYFATISRTKTFVGDCIDGLSHEAYRTVPHSEVGAAGVSTTEAKFVCGKSWSPLCYR